VEPIERLIAYFETLSPQRLPEIGDYYAADAYFKDPFNEVHRVEDIRAIFARMFAQLEAPRFCVLSRMVDGAHAFLVWELEFRFRGGKPARIHGVSRIEFGPDGRVTYHRDYWDAAEELYEKIPVLGAFMRWLRHRVG
jgi:steroid delta-isomerase